MKSSDRDKIISGAILLAALSLYFFNLPLKPPHADEGVNGFFVIQIWQNGFSAYDPSNYHGPLLFYLFQISEKIFGFGIYSFRIVTAAFSLLTVWLVLKSRDILGRYASFFAAVALAVSPGMIFFGRSAIHESVFVCFQALWMIGFLRLRERADRKGLLWFAVGLLGCVLLKETFVLLGFAFVLSWGWVEISPKALAPFHKSLEGPRLESWDLDVHYLMKVCAVVAFIWLFIFTGFFHHWKGAGDFFVALVPWLKTGAGGAGHGKPFSYWLDLMRRYEWAGIAGVAVSLPGFVSKSWKIRFFSSLALIQGFIYSAITYKTPWCIISILWPFLVVAGLYLESLWNQIRQWGPLAWAAGVAAAAIVFGHSLFMSYQLNLVNYENPSEPYVYVQTRNDVKVMEDIIRKKIGTSPEYQNMVIQVNITDCWPLPWLFSRFPNVAFGDDGTPFNPDADIILAEVGRDGRDLGDAYLRRQIDLREARQPVYVYVKKSSFGGIDLPGFGPVDVPPAGTGS